MVGSAIHRSLLLKGYKNIITRTLDELDLTRQADVENFFKAEKPEYVIDAAAKVGGIMANDTYRAQFIYENLMIQNNIIHNAYVNGVRKLLFLGSSCIYPKNAPQPLKEEYLLTGELEPTNEPYAIAKIAGIKMCESYNRQYGCNFISVMPTNLYGSNDNYDLEKSHVLPAMIRKMHLARCVETGDWHEILSDLTRRPVEGVNGQSTEEEIQQVLGKYGITLASQLFAIRHSPSDYPPPQPPSLQVRMGEQQEAGFRVTRNASRVTLWGTGNVFREFLHVDDMAAACVFVMERVDVPESHKVTKSQSHKELLPFTLHPSPFTFLNIGTGQDLTIRELAEMVKEIVGFEGEIMWDSTKPDGTLKKQLDVSRLHSAGWHEKINLEDGIRSVYKEYCGQG
jgi:GDP-L-fucose synthase